jgi:uncharacterized membrane protein YdjX (TVP38/TMEM64 family)
MTRVDKTISSREFYSYAKLFLLVFFLIVLSVIAWVSGATTWIDPNRLIPFLQSLGVLGPVAYMLMMAVAVVISPIPSLPLDAAAGAVYGPLLGTVYSVAGAEVGALISFFIARALGREAIVRLLKRDIAFCDLCADRQLVYVIFISRLLPVFSFDLISYGAGLTRISTKKFALATVLGMIPPTFVINYFGSGIFSGARLALLLGGIMVLLFFLVPVWIKRRNPWGMYDRLVRGTRIES